MISITTLLHSNSRFIPALRGLCEPAPDGVFLVGGCIRDALLGQPVSDVDLVVTGDALLAARAFARAVRGAFVLLDPDEGVGRVVVRRTLTFDFAPMKGATIEEDLAQRDFTINAVACRLIDVLDGTMTLIDPFHGMRDLQRQRLMAVSEQAFVQDPLRVLRAFRFAAQLRLDIDPTTNQWLRQHAALLPTVSVERIRDELALLLMEPHTTSWVERMYTAGVLQAALPELVETRTSTRPSFHLFQQIDAFLAAPDRIPVEALREALPQYLDRPITDDRRRSWLVRLAALLIGDDPDQSRTDAWTERIATERLRLSTHERQGLVRLVRLPATVLCLRHQTAGRDEALYAITREAGEETIGVALLAFAQSRIMDIDQAFCRSLLDRLLRLDARRRMLRASPRLVTGDDLMATFHLSPGPRVGTLLSRLEEREALGHIQSREDAFAAVREWLTGMEREA
ncbi:MAG: CCA tRNA nucleotidyltransferase [Candidatus Latescibacteria bacterium]|nr:CCA tRNA nucleotidyltransferase [Candidatus Latescibacterota bacterium]